MAELILTTFAWVPESPRGYVRDLRVRWALEEAALPYRVESVPVDDRGAPHFAHQPFGQVPWLTDGEISMFESGAILLHLGERSAALMPADPPGRAEVLQWTFAALNSVEMASLPWAIMKFSGEPGDTTAWRRLDAFLTARLQHLETVLAGREWLAGPFSIADILMADVLRLVDRFDGLHPTPPAWPTSGAPRPAHHSSRPTPTRWPTSPPPTDSHLGPQSRRQRSSASWAGVLGGCGVNGRLRQAYRVSSAMWSSAAVSTSSVRRQHQ